MTVYPGNGSPPNSSNINVTPGRSVPNMSLLTYGTVGADPYTISAYNFDGVDPLPARRLRRRARLS